MSVFDMSVENTPSEKEKKVNQDKKSDDGEEDNASSSSGGSGNTGGAGIKSDSLGSKGVGNASDNTTDLDTTLDGKPLAATKGKALGGVPIGGAAPNSPGAPDSELVTALMNLLRQSFVRMRELSQQSNSRNQKNDLEQAAPSEQVAKETFKENSDPSSITLRESQEAQVENLGRVVKESVASTIVPDIREVRPSNIRTENDKHISRTRDLQSTGTTIESSTPQSIAANMRASLSSLINSTTNAQIVTPTQLSPNNSKTSMEVQQKSFAMVPKIPQELLLPQNLTSKQTEQISSEAARMRSAAKNVLRDKEQYLRNIRERKIDAKPAEIKAAKDALSEAKIAKASAMIIAGQIRQRNAQERFKKHQKLMGDTPDNKLNKIVENQGKIAVQLHKGALKIAQEELKLHPSRKEEITKNIEEITKGVQKSKGVLLDSQLQRAQHNVNVVAKKCTQTAGQSPAEIAKGNLALAGAMFNLCKSEFNADPTPENKKKMEAALKQMKDVKESKLDVKEMREVLLRQAKDMRREVHISVISTKISIPPRQKSREGHPLPPRK